MTATKDTPTADLTVMAERAGWLQAHLGMAKASMQQAIALIVQSDPGQAKDELCKRLRVVEEALAQIEAVDATIMRRFIEGFN